MAPRKRARAAAASAAASTPKLTLSGGEPHHSELASLWRDARFTDIVVSAEGVECRAHRIVLASSSGYFRSRFDSGMRDAADHTHSLEGMRAPVLRALLAFVYEGSCEIEESQLTEMLDASARLMVEPLKAACAAMMASPDCVRITLYILSLTPLYIPYAPSSGPRKTSFYKNTTPI